LLHPASLKKTMSPRRKFDLGIQRDGSYLHWPPSVMGSLWPNALQVLLVRHVQLILLSVQVAYLYVMPRKRLALRTTRQRGVLPLAAVYSSPEVLGGVSDTSEGSFGPALAWVNVPCDGPPSEGGRAACEAFGKTNSKIQARVAAVRTVDKATVV